MKYIKIFESFINEGYTNYGGHPSLDAKRAVELAKEKLGDFTVYPSHENSRFNEIDVEVVDDKFRDIDKALDRENRERLEWDNHMQIDTFYYPDSKTIWTNYFENAGIDGVIFVGKT